MSCPYTKQATRLSSTHPMTLQEQNRIRGTTEMGAGPRTPSPACISAGQPCRRADAAVQIRVLAALVGLAGLAADVPI